MANSTSTDLEDVFDMSPKELLESLHITGTVLAAIMMGLSPLVTFFGARLLKPTIGAVGFCLGGYGAFLGMEALVPYLGEAQLGIKILIVVVVAVLAAVIMVSAYKASMFTLGAVGGGLGANALWVIICAELGENPHIGFRIGAVALVAIICGFVTYKAMGLVVKVITPFIGGFMFISGLDHLGKEVFNWWDTNPFDPSPNGSFFGRPDQLISEEPVHAGVLIGIWVLLTGLGLWWQFRDPKNKNQYKEAPRRESQVPYADPYFYPPSPYQP